MKIITATSKRIVFWGGLAVLLLCGIIYSFWPRAFPVDLQKIALGELVVTVDEEGKTRIRDIYILSAPVTGRLRRVEVDVGDSTTFSDTLIAEIEPIDPEFLDPRSEAQAQAEIRAAQSAKQLASAEVSQAQAELEFAQTELARAQGLAENKTISQRELDEAKRLFKIRRAALAMSKAALQVRNYELQRAKALLLSPTQTQSSHGRCKCIRIVAPVDGNILHVYHESEGVVSAGEPLVSIGNAQDLEIVVELQSAYAVKTQLGQQVIIENWGGSEELLGSVERIEPVGFTKVSALGIEEQRVNIIIAFESNYDLWQRLGHGYQLDVRIVLWRGENVLGVPLTALFRDGDQWALFVERDGRAEKRTVELDHQSDLQAEVTAGISAGEYVVLHPSDRVVDGVRIASRH